MHTPTPHPFRAATAFLLGLVLLATASTPLQAETPPPAKLLGPDTLAVLTVPNWKGACNEMAQSPANLLWEDPAMRPFREKFMNQFRKEFVQPMEKELGIRFQDYAGLAQGQVTLALTWPDAPEGEDVEPQFLFVMDAGDRAEDLRKARADLRQKWVDSGESVRNVTIRDVEFHAVKISSKDIDQVFRNTLPKPADVESPADPEEGEDEEEGELFVGQSGTLLICGQNQDELEQLLVRQSGGTLRNLGDNPKFAAAQNKHFRGALCYFWLNLQTIIQAAKAESPEPSSSVESPEENPASPSAGKVISALGLDALESISMSLVDQPNGSLFNFALTAPGGRDKGLLKMLAFDAKNAAPLPFIPADVVSFSRWRLDLREVWTTFEATFTEISPQMAGLMGLIIDNTGKDQDPNFDLRKNLIGNLGDDIIIYEKAPREKTLTGLNSPPSIALIQSPRADQLANALKSLASLMPSEDAKVREREFLGRTIYTLPLPPSAAPDGSMVRQSLTYVASGSYVALSTDTAMVEEYLRGRPAKALRDRPNLESAAAKVGGFNTGLFGFEDDRENMRTLFAILKNDADTLHRLFEGMANAGEEGGNGDASFKDWVDFSLLPDFEKVAKYFHFSVYSLQADHQGFRLKAYTPTPPELR